MQLFWQSIADIGKSARARVLLCPAAATSLRRQNFDTVTAEQPAFCASATVVDASEN